jgi:DivIVA domain-containing protein
MAGDSETQEISGPPEQGRKGASRARTRIPDHEIAEVRDVDFPVAMRGYDRAAVDSYVNRVNRLLAELQITAAPESAIRHALDEVADETRGILERAHETADEITRRSRAQADDRLQRAESEAVDARKAADDYAREIRAVAEKQLHALQADGDRVWQDRNDILTDLHELAAQLEQLAAHAAERYPARPDLESPAPAPAATPPPAPPAPPDVDEDEPPHPFPLDDV